MINEKKFADTYVHFDRETVVEIIDIFLEEYEERIEKISRQLKTRNFEELKKSTHAFKGVISNFETECKAYDEISGILEECHRVLDDDAISDMSEEELDEFTDNLQQKFNSFRKYSRQMYNQLKEIRKNYTD